MASIDGATFVMKLLRERHDELIRATKVLLQEIAGEDLARKKQASEAVFQKAKDLNAVIPAEEVPGWLKAMQEATDQFNNGRFASSWLLERIIGFNVKLNNHQWLVEKGDEAAVDFDAIFDRYRNESRLPELFDEIIKMLQEMHASGDIDSNAMLNALSKVISTLKACKGSSYFSINSAWDFLISFLNNYMWGALVAVPTFGPVLAALDKTIKEAEVEMAKVHSQVREELKRSVEIEVKPLIGKTSFDFIGYDRTGRFRPPVASFGLPAPSVQSR